MRMIKTFENDIAEYKSNALIISNYRTNKTVTDTHTEFFDNKSGVYRFVFTTIRLDMESRDPLFNERRIQIIQSAIANFMYSKEPTATLEGNIEKVFNYVTSLLHILNERLQSLQVFKEA